MQSITKELTPNFQGFTNLCKAHTAMMKVAADINETQRLYEASVKIKVISNGVCVCARVRACVCVIDYNYSTWVIPLQVMTSNQILLLR